MGRVSQNYSRGKHSPSFTGKSNHPKRGAGEERGGEGGGGIVQRGEEKMSSVVESWRKGTGGRATGWRVGEEKSVSDPFFYLMLQVSH